MEKVSRGREYDRQNRVLILDCMKVMVKMHHKTGDAKWIEKAKEFGVSSEKLAQRIKTHDYSQEDEEWGYVDNLNREAVVLWRGL